MDWDGLCAFLREVKEFLETSRASEAAAKGGNSAVDSLLDKCEFYLSTLETPPTTTNHHVQRFPDEVDTKGGYSSSTYLNMDPNTRRRILLDKAAAAEEGGSSQWVVIW